jgi:putative nucleotidyltransferase with HDIG domain
MIPDKNRCLNLLIKYQVPENKRRHLELVAKVADYISQKLEARGWKLDRNLLIAAALLHDIDKAVDKLPGEKHPDTAVRILKSEGLDEVADLVRTHPLHLILDPVKAPKTIEQKILYLSDKMVKYAVIGVDARFKLWNDENLPGEEQQILDRSYPLVKLLETEILEKYGITPAEITSQVDSK